MSPPGEAGRERRRLLAVSALPPWPVRDGYTLRASNFLTELSRRWDILLVSPEPRRPFGDPPEDLAWRRIPDVPATDTLAWRPDARSLLVERVGAELRDREFDAGLVWSGVEFVAAENPEFPPAVLDRIDCGTLNVWRDAWRKRGVRPRLRALRRCAELFWYERRALRPFRSVAVTGPADAAVLRKVSGHGRIVAVPNGVAVPDPGELPTEGPVPTVAFTGVLDYGPNVDAARHFAEDVWPRVHEELPDARFVIAGRSPTAEVLALAERPGIEVHADVPDMTQELRKAWISVAPMRSGSGIKNKVLEAWAAERPVVMTEVASNGLAMDDATRSLVVSGPAEMAKTVATLLSDDRRRRRLGEASRRVAEQGHGWPTVSRRLDDLLQEAVE